MLLPKGARRQAEHRYADPRCFLSLARITQRLVQLSDSTSVPIQA